VCFGLGSFVGPWAVGNIRTSSGSWQTPMVVFGVTGIAVAILVAVFVRGWFTETKGAIQHSDATGGADTLMNRNTIILSILSAIYGLIVYGFLGLYPTFLREVLKLTPAEAGAIMPFFGLGSLLSFFAGQLGDRFPVKLVLTAGWVVLVGVGIFLYVPGLSTGTYKFMALMFGIFGGAIVYTNLAGAHIKSLRRSLANKGSSMFISSIYAGGALGGYVMGSLVANLGWGVAGQLQVSLLALIGLVLAFGLRPSEMSQ
jgi:predicted MFS family arabinose efflux permease